MNKLVRGIAAGAALTAGVAGMGAYVSGELGEATSPGKSEATTTTIDVDEATVCIPSGRQVIRLQPGQGRNDAIHAIEGSGRGPGDPCWSEAAKAVDEAILETSVDPQYPRAEAGAALELPAAVAPQKPAAEGDLQTPVTPDTDAQDIGDALVIERKP